MRVNTTGTEFFTLRQEQEGRVIAQPYKADADLLCSQLVGPITTDALKILNEQLQEQLKQKGVKLDGEIVVVPQGLSSDPKKFIDQLKEIGAVVESGPSPSVQNKEHGRMELSGYRLAQQRAESVQQRAGSLHEQTVDPTVSPSKPSPGRPSPNPME
jgi:hypothetical protein